MPPGFVGGAVVAEPGSLEGQFRTGRILARSVLAMLLATVLLVAACFVLGQAVVFLCGWTQLQWWAPALGFAVLMIVFGQAVHHPNHQRALLALAIGLVVVSLFLPFVWRSLRDGGLDLLVLGLGMILLAAIPFFATGYAGILGTNVSNDMSQHLTAAYWLQHRTGVLPVAAIGGDLITTGYPLGPHAMAAGLSRLGLGTIRGFSAETLAIPALTGFIAFGIVPEARRGARWALAVAVGLGYLPAAYLAQGSFKEIELAMFALGMAVALSDMIAIEGKLGWRRAMPLGLFAGGAVYTYSYGGLLWLGAIVLFVLASEVFRRRELFALVRVWLPAAIGAAVVAAIVILPELHRMKAFRNSIFGQESLRNTGNLAHPLNPLETLGVWFNGDFRFNPDPRWPTTLFCVLAIAALVLGLGWWWRRRSLALPAAVVAALLVWGNLALTVNIYNAAKGLIVLAPIVMACIGAPLVAAWSRRAAPTRWRPVARVTGVVLLGGALVASFGVLRSAPVGLGSHQQEFDAMRAIVGHHSALFLDNDHFAEWELRGAKPLYTTNALYAPAHLGMHPEKVGGLPIDVDNYGSRDLDKVDYIVVSGGRYRSEIPPNWRLVLSTPSYDLYHRHGPTPERKPLEPIGYPGTIVDCKSKRGKNYLKRFKWAGVLPAPVITTTWQGSIAKPGETARTTVTLPRGRWDVSLQYVSGVPVTVRGPGLDKKLAQNFGLITTYWPAGTVTSSGGPVTISVTAAQRNWFGRLLGAPRGTRAPLSPGMFPLYTAAFTRHDETPRRIPAAKSCGRYADWFAPAGSAMRGR